MKWIPRDSNHQADSLSRIIDFDDYFINDDVFHMLDCKWGPHTVDKFACSYNAKLSRFNSDFTNPALKLWTLSPRTGREKIIGSFHRYRKLVELLPI